MSDPTWVVPYDCSELTSLGCGPSRGAIYELSKVAVIKMPFQYLASNDEDRVHHYQSSVRSIKHFQVERAFYLETREHHHPNIACLLSDNLSLCIAIERLSPLDEIWERFDASQHILWITQLLNAVTFLESKGILHGDLAVRNIGVGKRHELKLFDFGSIVRKTQEDYPSQLLDDHFSIATCVHFILSGVDPLHDIETIAQQRQRRKDLEHGFFAVAKEAEPLSSILQDCWTRARKDSLSTFSILQGRILAVIEKWSLPLDNSDHDTRICAETDIEIDLQVSQEWQDYGEFRSRWKDYLDSEELDEDLIE